MAPISGFQCIIPFICSLPNFCPFFLYSIFLVFSRLVSKSALDAHRITLSISSIDGRTSRIRPAYHLSPLPPAFRLLSVLSRRARFRLCRTAVRMFLCCFLMRLHLSLPPVLLLILPAFLLSFTLVLRPKYLRCLTALQSTLQNPLWQKAICRTAKFAQCGLATVA